MENRAITSWNTKNTTIKRRRREDLVIRVFKPGIEQQHVFSKPERKNNMLAEEKRVSLLPHSPKSMVSTPVDMYRKFLNRGNPSTQIGIGRFGAGREVGSIASPKPLISGWRLSRSSAGDQSTRENGFFRRSNPSASVDMPSMKPVSVGKRTHKYKGEQGEDYTARTLTNKLPTRSDSVITVGRAFKDQKKELAASELRWQRPIYLHGAIRLQEGFAAFSARKDSIASLEAFLTAVEPPKPVQESRRVSDDAAEQDVISFFESYEFDHEGYRLNRFWDEDYSNHKDYKDRSRTVDAVFDNDSSSGVLFRGTNSECRFLLDDVDPFRNEETNEDNDNTENLDKDFQSDSEPETEVIEIVLSQPIVDKTLTHTEAHDWGHSPLLSVEQATDREEKQSSPKTIVPERSNVLRRIWHVASFR